MPTFAALCRCLVGKRIKYTLIDHHDVVQLCFDDLTSETVSISRLETEAYLSAKLKRVPNLTCFR